MAHKYMKIAKVLSTCLLIFSACTDDDYLRYDTDQSGLYFTDDSLTYSFGVTPIAQRTYTLMVPVHLMGAPSKENRTFSIEVLPPDEGWKTNAEKNVQYTILDPTIQADSITGYIPVRLLRDGMQGKYPDFAVYYMRLRLTEGNGFSPTLSAKEQVILLRFDNAIQSPEWYDAYGKKVWTDDDQNRKKELGRWHPMKLIKMVEYFHDLEEKFPETYPKMVKLYGENLEHIAYGDPYQYATIFREHIYRRMYEYFSNPANHDEITREYPDYFPDYDDFPNPYAN